MARRLLRRCAVVAAASAVLVACSSGGDDAGSRADSSVPPLSLGDLPAAVAAVTEAQGTEPQYTEINVQPGLVNLFVAVGADQEVAYVWQDGALQDPGAPSERVEGAVPFGLDGVDLTAPDGFDDLLAAQVPDTELLLLTLAASAAGEAPTWDATLRSVKGGGMDVILSTGGEILGVVPR